MPMLVVNDGEFDLELSRLNSTIINEKVIDIERGRGAKVERSLEERKLIASEAIAGCSVEDIKKRYNTSASSISAYKNGASSTSSYHKPNVELEKNNKDVRTVISELASDKIKSSLNLLTDDKISNCGARDIAGITKDLSAIIKNITPETGMISNNQVIIYKPRLKEEDDYEIIEVTA